MVIDRLAGSVSSKRWRRDAELPVRQLRNEFLDRIVQLESAFIEQQQRCAGCDQLGIGKDAEDMVDPQWNLRFLVGPSDAAHIDEIPANKDRGRNAGEDVAIDVALHGGVRRSEVVAAGGNFQVFHYRSLCRGLSTGISPDGIIWFWICAPGRQR
jgi:hypothetical protein